MVWFDDYKVDLPEGVSGDVEIRKFEVPERSVEGLRLALAGRGVRPGWYTGLYRRNRLWMSDTPVEIADALGVIGEMRLRGGRVLMNGLGLGMTVKAALSIDPAALVASSYEGPRCTVHIGDAYEMKWPVGTRLTVAWHDIWENICGDNAEGIARLKRIYGRRVDYQEAWAEDEVRRANRRWG